ncbi:MAG: diguanylate cyclase [Armatimonadetes bacterium]|nr:diguanylate cyclase [Armatimonadota bacterium]
MKVRNLPLSPIWVESEQLVSSARFIAKGHKVHYLGVLKSSIVEGTVTDTALEAADDMAMVRTVMKPLGAVIGADDSIHEVAKRFYREGLDYAVATDQGKYLGVVTSQMLLNELSRSYDPLTELSWSDQLRNWGIEQLQAGREISILFLDLDDFGAYNKAHGHVVGDNVLRKTAAMLSAQIDPATEVLVRYGGDEFAIGSLRLRADAEELLDKIRLAGQDLRIDERAEPVSFSLGIYGGKRSKERENVHMMATLDNLINLASKDCLANKLAKKSPAHPVLQQEQGNDSLSRAEREALDFPIPSSAEIAKKEAAPPAPASPSPAPAKVAVEEVAVVEKPTEVEQPKPTVVKKLNGATSAPVKSPSLLSGKISVEKVYGKEHGASMTQVILRVDQQSYSGVHASTGGALTESVALATCRALERAYPGRSFQVEGIDQGPEMVSVVVRLGEGNSARVEGGVADYDTDEYQTVAQAIINAVTGVH